MNTLETIIKYLSDDLDNQAMTDFKKQLEEDTGLREEFNFIKQIWHLLEKQLNIEDLPDTTNREELLASIIAEHDIKEFTSAVITKKEMQFKEEFAKLIAINNNKEDRKKPNPGRSNYRLTLFIAAIAAILALVLIPSNDIYTLSSKFYNPSKDPDLEKTVLSSRGDFSNGLYYFKEGNYEAARRVFEQNEEQRNADEAFFYAIACFETGDFERAIALLEELGNTNDKSVSYKSKWYLALIYIKTGNTDQASKLISEIKNTGGIYHKQVHQLAKKLE